MELIRSVSSPGVAFVAVVLCGNAEVVGVLSWRLAIPSINSSRSGVSSSLREKSLLIVPSDVDELFLFDEVSDSFFTQICSSSLARVVATYSRFSASNVLCICSS